MAKETTGSRPKGLVPGTKLWFGNAYGEHKTEYSGIFDKETSNRAWEEYAGTIGYGLLQVKPETTGIIYDTGRQGYVTRITNVRYGLGFQVSYEAMKNNSWGPVAKRNARELAFSVHQTRESIFGLILSRAFNATYVGADGLELCSTAHLRKSDGTTWSNELTTAADLSELSIEQLWGQITLIENERGLKIPVNARKLIVYPTDYPSAVRITKSALQNDTMNNATNAIMEMGMFPDGVMSYRYFDAGNGAWFIKTNVPGLVCQEREAVKFDQDNDFETDDAKFKATDWFGAGWYDPLAIFGSAGAA